MGGELNSVVKTENVQGRFCMIFPDAYSIGMSCHAIQVLYALMNQQPGWACERSFAPQKDMEDLVRKYNLPWFSWETNTPLKDFDVLGFTLQHELCYTNLLTMLDVAGIPLYGKDRTDADPLVCAGGPCVWNPEPLADIIDVFQVGDGEKMLPECCAEWLELKQAGVPRQEALHRLAAAFDCIYVPACYRLDENFCPVPLYDDVPKEIHPAVVPDLEKYPLPVKPVIPWVEAVQDRVAVEVMRGCPWRCRFCQSCPIKRPLRFRSPETVVKAVEESIQNTGYEEVTLLSLSTGDYPRINGLISELNARMASSGVSISVPSLRVNPKLATLGEVLKTQKHGGLTIAVEAALEDMRTIIGKPITNDNLMEGCRIAFSHGFQRVKMYFMCGFPGETEADWEGIIELAEIVARLGKEVSGRWPKITISCSNLVTKPHTPFQWYGMRTKDYFREASRYLRFRRLPSSISIHTHDIEGSLLEGVMCRGDRRVGAAIVEAWRNGARFDSWTDMFKPSIWHEAFETVGLDVESILHKDRVLGDRFPWDFIKIRQGQEYLEREYLQSQEDLKTRQEQK